MLSSIGVECKLLPNHSPELSPIELVLNVMAQLFRARYHEHVFNADEDVLDFLHEVIDSTTPDIIVSFYKKCGHVNYF